MTSNSSGNKELIISHLKLRKAIGWLGTLLPFMLFIGNYCINQLDILNDNFFVNTDCSSLYRADGAFKTSISHYYYSTVGELFTGVLGTVALFMFCYKGHKKRRGEFGFSDNALSNLAGIFAIGVIVFPTASDECINDNLRIFLSSRNTGYIHFTMAALFFMSLSFMSMVNFRRTEERESFGKKGPHRLFLVCGIAMLTSIFLIFIYSMWLEGTYKRLDNLHPVFWLEALALIFFGISWLKKGKVDFSYIPKKLKLK